MAKFSGYKMFQSISAGDASDVGPNTQYPIGLTLEKMNKWYYRVKKWQFDILYTCNASAVADDSSASASLPGFISLETTITSSLVNEQYFSIIQPISEADEISLSDVDEDSGATSFARAECGFTTGFISMQFLNNIIFYDDLYYPYIGIGLQIFGQGDVNNPFDFYTYGKSAATDEGTYPNVIAINVEIDGEIFTINGSYNIFENGTSSGATAEARFDQITLTPIEYWSYDGTWNTSTGAQISDPFAYQP